MLFFPEKPLGNDILCFTTSTNGGVSKHPFQSFNIGAHVGDSPYRVDINRRLLTAMLQQHALQARIEHNAIAPIKWLNQQHTCNVLHYEHFQHLDQTGQENQADAIVCSSPNTPLAVMTADCIPIVVMCPESGKIAAVHAGWRGLMNNIIASTVKHFSHTNMLRVWMGPSISSAHFQISDDIINLFESYQSAIKDDNEPGKYLVDLPRIALAKLNELGIDNIQQSAICTYSNPACFSHRRAQHNVVANSNEVAQTGRMATIIMRLGDYK